ncbi:DUF6279 family lipoprotein [Teredinibacter waterburyi]|jgi:hypothetical protein|uniref:DUF6279 family lipoprotein n=1 Tax=Teredinibacter waterburyi TaxID=1500538 RepID=UPI00165F5DB2|nr:DUF6279 family lipoprotein [Teredinibacter waterburyi]
MPTGCNTPRKLSKRLSIAVICLFVLNGCATKLAYNFLDWGMSWYVERYVTLSNEQQRYVKAELDNFHTWHRETQLAQYALYIEGLQVRLDARNFTPQMVHDETDRIQVFLDIALARLVPFAVELIASFSDEQVAEVMENLAKKREEYKHDFIDVSAKKLFKARRAEINSYLKMGIPRFNATQTARLKSWSETLVPFEKLTLKQQQLWADELHQAMLARKDKAKLRATLERLMFVHTDHWDKELESITDENQDMTYTMLSDLLNSQTDAQRKQTHKKLEQYIKDFRSLALAKVDKK